MTFRNFLIEVVGPLYSPSDHSLDADFPGRGCQLYEVAPFDAERGLRRELSAAETHLAGG